MGEIQKILLAFTPAFFYFAPHLFFPGLYKRYVEKSYLQISNPQHDIHYQIKSLTERISRIIDFITFLVIVVTTLIAIVYDRMDRSYFFSHPLVFYYTLLFTALSIACLAVNFRKEFELSLPLKLVESGTVLFSVFLIYQFG